MSGTTTPPSLVFSERHTMLRLALTALIVVAVLALPTSADAGTERMTLDCGDPIGVIERTNGASWWSQGDDHNGVTYVTRSLMITHESGEVVFQKDYGHRAGLESVTCHATHTDEYDGSIFTWTIDLAPVD